MAAGKKFLLPHIYNALLIIHNFSDFNAPTLLGLER